MLPAAKLVKEVCASSKGPHLYVSKATLPSANSTALKQGFVEEVLMADSVVSETDTVAEAHCLDDTLLSVSVVGPRGMLESCLEAWRCRTCRSDGFGAASSREGSESKR